jgi:hypothetical protein
MKEDEADDSDVFLYLGEFLGFDESSDGLKVFDEFGLALEIESVALNLI